jgi:hypothetical protein
MPTSARTVQIDCPAFQFLRSRYETTNQAPGLFDCVVIVIGLKKAEKRSTVLSSFHSLSI